MCTRTKHPVVFIHGVLGYGKIRPVWGFCPPYWPENVLKQLNPNTILVDVGGLSSDHDRACEAFYQIYGGTVDYGAKHAHKTKHLRYGATYTNPAHPKWSAQYPIHIIGHSMGSVTAIELYQLLCKDYFGVGTSPEWISSITCIAGPLTGSTLVDLLGLRDDTIVRGSTFHILYLIIATWFKLCTIIPGFRSFFDPRLRQWEHLSWSQVFDLNGPCIQSQDLGAQTCAPSFRIKRNRELQHMDKLYLMSITTTDKIFPTPSIQLKGWIIFLFLILLYKYQWMKKIHRVKKLFLLFGTWLSYQRLKTVDYARISLLRVNKHTNIVPFEGYESDHWGPTDGVVNIHSMLRPWFPPESIRSSLSHCSSHVSMDGIHSIEEPMSKLNRCPSHVSIDGMHPIEEPMSKGKWYVYRIDANHFAGTNGDQQAYDLYQRLFYRIIHKYET